MTAYVPRARQYVVVTQDTDVMSSPLVEVPGVCKSVVFIVLPGVQVRMSFSTPELVELSETRSMHQLIPAQEALSISGGFLVPKPVLRGRLRLCPLLHDDPKRMLYHKAVQSPEQPAVSTVDPKAMHELPLHEASSIVW